MPFLNDYLEARAIRTNPAYARQAQLEQQYQYDQQLAEQNADIDAQAVRQERQYLMDDQDTSRQRMIDRYGAPGTEAVTDEAGNIVTPAVAGSGAWHSDPIERARISYMNRNLPNETVATSAGEVYLQSQKPNEFKQKIDAYNADRTGYAGMQAAERAPQQPTAWQSKINFYDSIKDDPNALKSAVDSGLFGSAGVTINTGDATPLTIGEEAIDKAFAQQYVDFTTQDASDQVKLLAQLKDAKNSLESGNENLTGAFLNMIPESIKNITNPGAISTQEAVAEVIQRNLKAILGGQFTEREGEKLVARAYNPALEEAENAKRVGRLITQMEKAYEQKLSAVQYMNENGTLKGWTGKLPTLSDFGVTDDTNDPKIRKWGEKK